MPIISWGLIGLASLTGALSALYVALAPAADQTPLSDRTWAAVATADPEVGAIVARLLVVLGLLGVGFGLLAFLVTLGPYRQGQRWAWNVLWLLPIIYGAIAARQLADGYPVAYLYGALAAMAIIGLVLGRRAPSTT